MPRPCDSASSASVRLRRFAARHDGVRDDDGPVEKLAVLDLDAEGRFLRKVNGPARGNGHDVARCERGPLFTF